MAEILKGTDSLDEEGKLDEVGDTNFKKLMEIELGRDREADETPDIVNGVPVRVYRI